MKQNKYRLAMIINEPMINNIPSHFCLIGDDNKNQNHDESITL